MNETEIVLAIKPRQDCKNCFGKGWYNNIHAKGNTIRAGQVVQKAPRVCGCAIITGIYDQEEKESSPSS